MLPQDPNWVNRCMKYNLSKFLFDKILNLINKWCLITKSLKFPQFWRIFKIFCKFLALFHQSSNSLCGRRCCVLSNGLLSYESSFSSGVPQGSNLGPLLFNLFISALLLSLSCFLPAYADDNKFYNQITIVDDSIMLQT